ncbi:MAG: coiled-coil domain-containing protein [Promethearchaeota archaeon]
MQIHRKKGGISISKNNFKVFIGSKEVLIRDRFTLIKGKIKKNSINNYKNDLFLEISQDLNLISLERFIDLLQVETENSPRLLKSNHLLDYIHDYRKIISNNIDFSSQLNKIMKILVYILRYNRLLKKKQSLLRELELSSQYKKSSDIIARTDLLKKLNESLAENKIKLEYLEEDYFQLKNQTNEIKKTINNYNKKIQELIAQKKKYFSDINRITRNMSGDTQNSKNKTNFHVIESDSNLTNAEKIKNLQKKAKEIQFEINGITSEKNQTQIKLDELIPIFETYKKDYQRILDMINSEEKRIKDLQSELKNKIKDEDLAQKEKINDFDINLLRPIKEIKEDIEKTDLKLKKITIQKNYYNPQNPKDLSQIIQKLNELNEKLTKNSSDIIININEKEISECLQGFRELEQILNNIESLTNKFLLEINLKSQFRIIVKNDNKSFFINIEFIRKDKEKVLFEELTTPEKIFFIIAFYVTIKIYFKVENIIFSNKSFLSKYNKAGSIYRTIRKILPLFEREEDLSKFNLIFILPNLELKKEIEKLKIITINEVEDINE